MLGSPTEITSFTLPVFLFFNLSSANLWDWYFRFKKVVFGSPDLTLVVGALSRLFVSINFVHLFSADLET